MSKIKTPPAGRFLPLDEEERKLMEETENGKYRLISEEESLKAIEFLREAVTYTYKTKPEKTAVTIRLDAGSIWKVKAKALKLGMPYQTLIGMLIHKYANDELQIVI